MKRIVSLDRFIFILETLNTNVLRDSILVYPEDSMDCGLDVIIAEIGYFTYHVNIYGEEYINNIDNAVIVLSKLREHAVHIPNKRFYILGLDMNSYPFGTSLTRNSLGYQDSIWMEEESLKRENISMYKKFKIYIFQKFNIMW